MSLSLIWRESALDDLDAIVEYIGLRDMAAAFRLQTTIEACAERLVDHPYMYRPGRIAGTREAVAVEVLGGCTAGSNIRRASDRTAPIAP